MCEKTENSLNFGEVPEREPCESIQKYLIIKVVSGLCIYKGKTSVMSLFRNVMLKKA